MPSSRTFTFTINVGTAPTNTFYLIDFNDGSPVSLPTYMPTTSSQVSYTYAGSGIYNVNVTTFNKISSMSRIVTVRNLFFFPIVIYLNQSIKIFIRFFIFLGSNI